MHNYLKILSTKLSAYFRITFVGFSDFKMFDAELEREWFVFPISTFLDSFSFLTSLTGIFCLFCIIILSRLYYEGSASFLRNYSSSSVSAYTFEEFFVYISRISLISCFNVEFYFIRFQFSF